MTLGRGGDVTAEAGEYVQRREQWRPLRKAACPGPCRAPRLVRLGPGCGWSDDATARVPERRHPGLRVSRAYFFRIPADPMGHPA